MMLLSNAIGYVFCLVQKETVIHEDISDDVLKNCETEGFNASTSNLPHTANPYPEGSLEHKAWNTGFWIW